MSTAVRLEAFLEMMSAERGASDNTLAAYRRDLEDAAAFLGGRLVEAGSDDIRAFLDDVARRGFAPTSQARKLSSLRQFFRFLYAEGLRTDDPTGTVDAPRKERALPRTMREDAVARLIARAETEKREAGEGPSYLAACRLHALTETLYATGLRVSELVSLRRAAVMRDAAFLTVTGKGNKERIVPVLPAARAAVENYLKLCPYALAKDDPLFVGGRGKRLNQRQVRDMMINLRRRLGLPESATPHALRHSFATHLLEDGTDIRIIQVLLGHAKLNNTAFYTKVATRTVRTVTSPLDKLGLFKPEEISPDG